ncbi:MULTISPECIES: DHA2 family efflux MFS transporter permease subunit [Streptomyces]|uniref:DHA2 family efflux MFS transporter permease subunit n=1 Tax=Streptomyces evansiae TaxID=3075535 RepID=A0ABU2R205_9ACTN|nr:MULTISPECIES: DHA2 family efflux MFS transporter permease subunit [unclassified Streptomyces]MDT0410149.1 DHA2 family efflux MFS transporter permease subunit [Streptomyces sp. DSM 41979]MYQ57671.1 DHA2 family efflux MFS transporter permease subunit [Streptomyces sp. SID4926]SCE56509.1 drug resistance transporter, EmrB/QacA subfamily [Streptomyces sp. DfronAA-171]
MSRRLVLAVLCVGQLMVILDGTIVNVALPAIQENLAMSAPALAWVVNAYLIPFAGLLLLSGRLGDLFGRRRVFLAGLALFTLASLLCGLAPNAGTLLAFRFLQGVGGAVASSVTLAMVVTLYSGPKERAKALGVYSFVQSAGGTLGLLLGGALTQLVGWHWIFFVNVPIGLVVLLLARRELGIEETTPAGRRLDVPGAVLVTAALMTAVYAIVESGDHGFGSSRALGCGLGALVLLAAFLVRQARGTDPLLPPRMFRFRNVSGALGTHLLLISGMFGFQFLAVLYMQRVLGFDEIRTGLAVTPVSLLIGAMSLFVAPRLIARIGARRMLAAALVLIAAGLALLGQVSANGAYLTDVFPATVPLGVGFGLAMPSLVGLAMSGATPGDAGLASGMFNSVQQIGAALGLAVLSTLAASHTRTLRAEGTTEPTALTEGYQLAFRVGAALVLTALVVATAVLRDRPASAEAEAESVEAEAEAEAEAPSRTEAETCTTRG